MDEVYVIYLDGKMYKNSSRKIVYLTKGRAKSVVTAESKHMAEEKCWGNNNHKYMFELSEKEQKILINKQKQRFEIKTFVPKDDIKIKQLLESNNFDQVNNVIKLLLKRLNELNKNSKITYHILNLHHMGEMPKRSRPSLDDEDIEYDDLEPSTWQPRKVIKATGKCVEVKRADNILYKEKEDDD